MQRAPSQSLPVKLEVRSGNQKKKKKERKQAWVEHFTPTPKRPPLTYTFRFVHVGWGHRHNHPCQVSCQSVQQFLLPRGSKFTISHMLGEWLLQQCYALTCYTVIKIARSRHVCLHCTSTTSTPSFIYLISRISDVIITSVIIHKQICNCHAQHILAAISASRFLGVIFWRTNIRRLIQLSATAEGLCVTLLLLGCHYIKAFS